MNAGATSGGGGDVSAALAASSLLRRDTRTLQTYDLWVEGQATRYSVDEGDGQFLMLQAGFDYLATPDLLIGVTGQFDRSTLEGAANAASEIEGHGFMAGPYATLRVDEALYLDATASWGMSFNEVSPLRDVSRRCRDPALVRFGGPDRGLPARRVPAAT